MSKLINMYKQLKQEDSKTIYLFKSGIFYLFLDEDAKKVHELLGLKLTNLNANYLKCGFPISSLEKYTTILKNFPIATKIINAEISTQNTLQISSNNPYIQNLINQIKAVNVSNLSIREAYSFIEDIQNKAKKIN